MGDDLLRSNLDPATLTVAQTDQIIMTSLSKMYQKSRFLGGFSNEADTASYIDESKGKASAFTGREAIPRAGATVYELLYHSGLVKP